MKLSDFSYTLPPQLIAQHPPLNRGSSRLLVLNRQTGKLLDSEYGQVAHYMQSGDVLVLNDTRVLMARLQAKREDGTSRELIV